MSLKVTYYLEVISSWCYWAEPAWAELKRRYATTIDFTWKVALLDASSLPKSREQMDWFYRRSGTITRSPFMLNSAWFEPGVTEYLAPNLVAEAARDLGITDDRVRLAIAHAALRDGRKIARWEECAAIGAQAAGLEAGKLLTRAKSQEIETRARATTEEFHALKVTQRPTFVIEDPIGDRAVLSGLVTLPPLLAVIEAMLDDTAAYESHAAHHGAPPSN